MLNGISSDREGAGLDPAVGGLMLLVVGAAIGAIAALVLAPKSGGDLRSDIAARAGNWKAHALDAIAQSRERVASAVESSRARQTSGPSHF
jgi:gas vesicle protein